MYQKDYILRMIEMFGEMLAAIFALIKKGSYKKASQALENAYMDLLHQNSSELLQIQPDQLIETFEKNYRFNHQQLEIVAGLLYAEAELRYQQKQYSKSKINFKKSMLIYQYLEKEQKTFSVERQRKISIIEKRISEIK